MKSKITLLNMVSSLAAQVCTIVSGFIVPKIIISYFGSEVNGLIASLNQFLSYISLVEGGITGVIAASLYKPLVQQDHEKISSIMVTADRFFRTIGMINVGYTLVLACVYPLLFDTAFSFSYIFILTIILSLMLSIQYMFSLALKTLLTTDKKVYIVCFAQSFITLANIVLTLTIAKVYPNVHLIKLANGILYVIQPLLFGRYVRRHYQINWSAQKDESLLKERWNGFAINVAAFIHNSVAIVILTIFTNLQTVSIYTVYALVTNGLKQLVSSIVAGINPSLGQAYVKNDLHELNNKMDLYEYIIFLLVGLSFTLAGLLITPFVLVYTNGVTDTNYNQPLFGALLVLAEAIYLIKFPHLNLAYSANKFKEIKKAAYMESAINIIVSLALVKGWGLIGVAVGNCAAMLYRAVFHVAYTNKLMKRPQKIFYQKLLVFLIATTVGMVICQFTLPFSTLSYNELFICATVYGFILATLYGLITVCFFKKERVFLWNYIRKKEG